MKNTKNKVSRFVHNIGFEIKKNSPKILLLTGIGCGIGATVMACKATLKVDEILAETEKKVNDIHTVAETHADKYTENDQKKDLAIVYARTGFELVKLYGPALGLGALSIGCILTSNNIMNKRNLALAAAYTALDTDFKGYRSRVVDRFGKVIDRELKHDIKAKEFEETEVDEETGEEKVVRTTTKLVAADDVSGYARYFERYTRVKDKHGKMVTVPNTHWSESNEYNILFLKQTQEYANKLLQAKGRVFLNEVYRMLGIPESQEGQIVGWIYDEECPMGDNYISFGIHNDELSYSDFVYGNDDGILLDFNVDGNIWENM